MAGRPKLNYDENFWQKMQEIYPQKGGSKVLARMFGISEGTVCAKAKERGIRSDMNSRLQFYRESVQNGHFKGMLEEWVPQVGGVTYLTGLFGVTDEVIRREAGKLDICSPEASTKRYHKENLKTDFFKTWDELRAYYLGYIWADGSVLHNYDTNADYALQLWCKRSDEDHIIKLRDTLGSQHAIVRDSRKNPDGSTILNKDGSQREFSQIVICSQDLAKSLIEDHGILPNKSFLDLPFPTNIPDDLMGHFARGYFDGDGCCGEYRYGAIRKRILYYLGSDRFIHGLYDQILYHVPVIMITPQNTKNTWIIQWQSLDDIQKLYHWMYPPGDYLYLPRKRDLLERMLSGESVPVTEPEDLILV
jgi:hypothetical protein